MARANGFAYWLLLLFVAFELALPVTIISGCDLRLTITSIITVFAIGTYLKWLARNRRTLDATRIVALSAAALYVLNWGLILVETFSVNRPAFSDEAVTGFFLAPLAFMLVPAQVSRAKDRYLLCLAYMIAWALALAGFFILDSGSLGDVLFVVAGSVPIIVFWALVPASTKSGVAVSISRFLWLVYLTAVLAGVAVASELFPMGGLLGLLACKV